MERSGGAARKGTRLWSRRDASTSVRCPCRKGLLSLFYEGKTQAEIRAPRRAKQKKGSTGPVEGAGRLFPCETWRKRPPGSGEEEEEEEGRRRRGSAGRKRTGNVRERPFSGAKGLLAHKSAPRREAFPYCHVASSRSLTHRLSRRCCGCGNYLSEIKTFVGVILMLARCSASH